MNYNVDRLGIVAGQGSLVVFIGVLALALLAVTGAGIIVISGWYRRCTSQIDRLYLISSGLVATLLAPLPFFSPDGGEWLIGAQWIPALVESLDVWSLAFTISFGSLSVIITWIVLYGFLVGTIRVFK